MERSTRSLTVLATAVVVGAVLLSESLMSALASTTLLIAVLVGWMIVVRRPESSVGAALAWCGGAVALVTVVGALAMGTSGERIADWVRPFAAGIWPVNLAGVFALLWVFPDGRLRGRVWSCLPWLFVAATAAVATGLWGSEVEAGRIDGEPVPWRLLLTVLGLCGIGVAMVSGVISTAVRFRRGDERQRDQIKWLMLAGSVVVTLLIGGWVAEALGVSLQVAFTPFLAGIVVLMPLAVGIAIVRHDLLDIDRLLGDGASWALTFLLSAAVFGVAVVAVGEVLHRWTTIGSSLAAFVAALALLPTHHYVRRVVGSVVDRDRHVAVAAVESFTRDVRAGRREPEEIESVLRTAQREPGMRLLLADGASWVDLDGVRTDLEGGVLLEGGGGAVARLVLTRDSARAARRAAELLRAGWVPIEVSRLRLGLRQSRVRLARAAAEERLRLERDLHDGIQQRLVATGMRLSLLQRRLEGEPASELGTAIDELLETVGELRRVAHGIRPSRLDDGLGSALEAVAATSPLPTELIVGSALPEVDDARAQAAFLTVSEALANVLKHARATRVEVRVDDIDGRLRVSISDDGVGGAHGMITLRDRVESVGGELVIDSPPGSGTTVTAVL